jgi:uncharacterized membrane protein YfcA
MDFAILFFTGLVVGLMSSFFGVGGGSIMIPILYWLFPTLPSTSIIPISLGTIFLNTLFNNLRFYRMQLSPGKKTILIFIITCSLGALIGIQVVKFMDTQTNKMVFSIFLLIVVAKLLFSKKQPQKNTELKEPPVIMAITGIMGAFISSLTGLGGGIVYTPMLLTVAKVPVIHVTPFSNVAMCIAALVGVTPMLLVAAPTNTGLNSILNQFFVGQVNFAFIAILFVGSIISGHWGVRLNQKVDAHKKKLLLAILLAIFAGKTLFSTL